MPELKVVYNPKAAAALQKRETEEIRRIMVCIDININLNFITRLFNNAYYNVTRRAIIQNLKELDRKPEAKRLQLAIDNEEKEVVS